ncbi:hypothetical protein TKK_0001804 [Trichogramma kaykai]
MKSVIILATCAIIYCAPVRAVEEDILDDVESRRIARTVEDVVEYTEFLKSGFHTSLHKLSEIKKTIEKETIEATIENSKFISEIIAIFDEAQNIQQIAEEKHINVADCQQNIGEVYKQLISVSEQAEKCIVEKSQTILKNANQKQTQIEEAIEKIIINELKAKKCAEEATSLNVRETMHCYKKAKFDSKLVWFVTPGKIAMFALSGEMEEFKVDLKRCKNLEVVNEIATSAKEISRQIQDCVKTKMSEAN